MYQLDNKRLADVIQHAYNDTGLLNDYVMQEYLALLQQGLLKQTKTPPINIHPIEGSDQPYFGFFGYAEATSGNTIRVDIEESTSSEAINRKNEEDKECFDKQSYKFLYTLRHTVFEDGMDNETNAMFDRMTSQNKYVAIVWLQEFWAEHQEEAVVLEGVIRLIGRIRDKAYWKSLMSIVRTGLTDKSESVQEAAVMVTESWRTHACYQALKQTQFSDGWIKDYASEVLSELEEELKDEIYKEN